MAGFFVARPEIFLPENKMEILTLPLFGQCAAAIQMLMAASLMIASLRPLPSCRDVLDTAVAYFFSFSPVALLIYMLYEVSLLK